MAAGSLELARRVAPLPSPTQFARKPRAKPLAVSGQQTADHADFRFPDLSPLDDHALIHRKADYAVRRGEVRTKSRRKKFFRLTPWTVTHYRIR